MYSDLVSMEIRIICKLLKLYKFSTPDLEDTLSPLLGFQCFQAWHPWGLHAPILSPAYSTEATSRIRRASYFRPCTCYSKVPARQHPSLSLKAFRLTPSLCPTPAP